MNAQHARALAARMLTLTGEMPAVALSDDPASLSVLTRFRSGAGRWLVVVKMASEGFDCPDIRVVLWMTNVTSAGAFRQIVARALRVVPGLLHQDAQVFLPADRRLLALARGLVDPQGGDVRAGAWSGPEGFDQEDGNGENGNRQSEENRAEDAGPRGEGSGLFVPLTSRAFGQRVVTNGAVVPASIMRRARAMNAGPAGFSGLPDYALAAAIARMETEANELTAALPETVLPGNAATEMSPRPITEARAISEAGEVSETYDHETGTYDQRRQELRRLCTRLTALIARELDVNPSVVHRAFHRSLGVRQADSTLAELEERKHRLEDKLRELRAGGS